MTAELRIRFVFPAMLALAAGCSQGVVSAEPPQAAGEASVEQQLGKQLRINKAALFEGSTEQIRIDAATVLLLSEDAMARKILTDTLAQTAGVEAKIAVCKALSQSRTASERPKRLNDFAGPLLKVLETEENFDTARLAAEAMIVLDRNLLTGPLEKMAVDPSEKRHARINAMYAMRLQPDFEVIKLLMKLLDDTDNEVALEAEEHLRSLGIPIAKDPQTRQKYLDELESKGLDAFLRDLGMGQEARVSQLTEEVDFWRKQYLSALSQLYVHIKEDKARSDFLALQLADEHPAVRLWALDKLKQWRLGTKSKLPFDKIEPVLLALISNENRLVRLRTSELLGLMIEMNSAGKLLEQLRVEKDEEVRMELFAALGGACHYALTPNSGSEVSEEVKTQTLEWAGRYLGEGGFEKPIKGAEVIRKMLEHEGWDTKVVGEYLGLLVKRYAGTDNDPQARALRGELLRNMARICSQDVYKDESAKAFRPLFNKALYAETDLIREAAVDGLINIDASQALTALRDESANDPSARVRARLIELARQAGGHEDLVWLTEKLGQPQEHQPAWQAMLDIFKRSDADIMAEWLGKLELQVPQGLISGDEWLFLLEMAERKAASSEKPGMLNSVREKMAVVHSNNGNFERAASYWGQVNEAISQPGAKAVVRGNLLNAYLRWPNLEQAVGLVHICLLEEDLGPDSPVVATIDAYLETPAEGADPNTLVGALEQMVVTEARPMWADQMRLWSQRLTPDTGPEKPSPEPVEPLE
jgi:HEAT repeat protein